MTSRFMRADVLRSVGFGSITTSYGAIGSALEHVWRLMAIKNTTDKTLFISEDGVNDHYEIPPSTSEYFDLHGRVPYDQETGKAIGTQFYVKAESGALPTSGKIILEGQYV